MRLLIAQYAGDYREAFYNLAADRGETQYALYYVQQQYSFVAVPIAAARVDEIAPLEGYI